MLALLLAVSSDGGGTTGCSFGAATEDLGGTIFALIVGGFRCEDDVLGVAALDGARGTNGARAGSLRAEDDEEEGAEMADE